MLFSKIRLVSFIFFFFCVSSLYGQDPCREIRIAVSGHTGFLWGHSFNAMHLAGQKAKGFELEVAPRPISNWKFFEMYPHSVAGLSAQAFFLDKDPRVGNEYALLAFFQQETGFSRSFRLFYRIGAGLGYASETFDILENNTNNLISTHINFALTGKAGVRVKLTPRLYIAAGIGILHFSNGAYKMPNLGTNIPSVFITAEHLQIRIGDKDSYWHQTEVERFYFFEGSIKGGVKEAYPVGGPKYPIFVITGLAGRQLNAKSSINAGIDFQYDHSIKRQADTMGLGGGFNYTRTAVAAGHELHLGKTSVLIQLGAYVYQPIPFYTKLYQRYGLKYYFKDGLFAQVTLKTHGGRADFVEWGIGMRLRKK